MEIKEEDIINLYKEGKRISAIEKSLGYKIDREDIEYIVTEYRGTVYLDNEINNVSYKNIMDLYLNRKTVLEIINIYPELNFGQVRKVISNYFKIFSMKKPYPIEFPKDLIKVELQNKSIEEVAEEYGYTVNKIKKDLNIGLTADELIREKMRELEKDTKELSNKEFRTKYNNINLNGKNVILSKNIAKKLVLEYKSKNK